LARRCEACAGIEQRERVARALYDLVEREDREARRGELEGERDAVERATQLAHDGRVRIRQGELRLDRLGALDEQTHRLELPELVCTVLVAWRQRQRRYAPHGFARDPQRFTTGCQDPQVRAAPQQEICQFGTRAYEVLTVVDDQHEAPRPQHLGQLLPRCQMRMFRNPEHRRDSICEQIWIGEGRQVNECHGWRVVCLEVRCDLQCKTRFANPARPRQGEQPAARQ
jgi:hypothetical protein